MSLLVNLVPPGILTAEPVDEETIFLPTNVSEPWWTSWSNLQYAKPIEYIEGEYPKEVVQTFSTQRTYQLHGGRRCVGSGSYARVEECERIDLSESLLLVAKRISLRTLGIQYFRDLAECTDPLAEIAIQFYLTYLTWNWEGGPVAPILYDVALLVSSDESRPVEVLIIMEKLDYSLDHLLRDIALKHKPDIQETRRICTDIVLRTTRVLSQILNELSLAFLFEHRDITLTNIMFREGRTLCFIDFGLARLRISEDWDICTTHFFHDRASDELPWRDLSIFVFLIVMFYSNYIEDRVRHFFEHLLAFPVSQEEMEQIDTRYKMKSGLFSVLDWKRRVQPKKSYAEFHHLCSISTSGNPFTIPAHFFSLLEYFTSNSNTHTTDKFIMETCKKITQCVQQSSSKMLC